MTEIEKKEAEITSSETNPITVIVCGVDLCEFIKKTGMTKNKTGYEFKYNGVLHDKPLKSLRPIIAELRDVTESELNRAFEIVYPKEKDSASKAFGYEPDEYKAVSEIVKEYDLIYVIIENRYYYFSGSNHTPCEQSAFKKLHDPLCLSNGSFLMDKVLRDEKRQYSHIEFNPFDFDRNVDNKWNSKNIMIKKCLPVDLSEPEFIPELDALFDALAGECDISKTVHERWFVANWYNTKFDNLTAARPFFCYYGGNNGGGGAGRSIFWKDIMQMIYGTQYCTSLNSKTSNSSFNGAEENKRIVLYNEMKKVDAEDFTEQSKDKEDSTVTIHKKNEEAKSAYNVATYACSVNGSKFPIIVNGNHDDGGTDRRYQFSRGTNALSKILFDRGLLKVDEKNPLKYATRPVVKTKILNLNNIKKHLAYLYHKHIDWLETNNWQVLGEENPAYLQQCEIQSAAWVTESLVPYIIMYIKPNEPKTMSELFEVYKNSWVDFDDKFKISKIDVFIDKVKSALKTNSKLNGLWTHAAKANKKSENGNRTTVHDAVCIKKSDYDEYLKSLESSGEKETDDDVFQEADDYLMIDDDEINNHALFAAQFVEGLDKIKTSYIDCSSLKF